MLVNCGYDISVYNFVINRQETKKKQFLSTVSYKIVTIIFFKTLSCHTGTGNNLWNSLNTISVDWNTFHSHPYPIKDSNEWLS